MDNTAPAFRKSSYSSATGANCVEVADLPSSHLVRDSKLGPASPVLSFTVTEWSAFITSLKL